MRFTSKCGLGPLALRALVMRSVFDCGLELIILMKESFSPKCGLGPPTLRTLVIWWTLFFYSKLVSNLIITFMEVRFPPKCGLGPPRTAGIRDAVGFVLPIQGILLF